MDGSNERAVLAGSDSQLPGRNIRLESDTRAAKSLTRPTVITKATPKRSKYSSILSNSPIALCWYRKQNQRRGAA
ncbi:hypothetical protein HDF14_001401 [Edaphobacter lichenicola]|uniref:Uncharacterized protein n=1 Tax=Tunturiibacter gelidiferens TaxID=3069689 RepID=A0A9X0QCG0_9BACT|nr:hypothetical protein [Edaphobacter lichenicola]